MKDAEELARETIGADALAGVGYDQYIPWVVKGIKAARAEMEREHRAPRETVLTKEEVEERQRTSSQAGLASIRRQPIDMIFIGGEK